MDNLVDKNRIYGTIVTNYKTEEHNINYNLIKSLFIKNQGNLNNNVLDHLLLLVTTQSLNFKLRSSVSSHEAQHVSLEQAEHKWFIKC